MKILNVDDNRTNLYFLESLLRSRGHEVVSVLNGVEALAELGKAAAGETRGGDQAGFDLIVSDILMPEMDGFQLCREVKTSPRHRHIPIIIYTATYTSRQDEQFALSLGAARFIVKPAEPEELGDAVEEVFRTRERAETAPEPAPATAEDYLRVYNQRLIRKLERKVEQLEVASAGLARSEAQLRLIWTHSIDGMLLTDESGKILRANTSFAEMCGIDPDEIVGRNCAELGWSDATRVRALYAGGDTGGPFHFEQSLTRRDGTMARLDASVTTFGSGAERLFFGLFRDVTERRRKETERTILEAQLAGVRRLESIGRLAGGVAHDFNNLLTVIAGYCDLLMQELPQGGDAAGMVEQIGNAGRRAAELTEQLLAFSRGRKTAESAVDLNALIESSTPMIQRLVGDHIHLVTHLEPGLASVMGDDGRFLQVIMNLAANARDAMPGGGVLTIATASLPAASPKQSAGQVSLTIRDTGVGIPDEAVPYIFDAFYSTKEEQGTGLGLFTVSGIVRSSGGSVAVRTGEGGGTIFEILLPAAAPETIAAAADRPVKGSLAVTGASRPDGGETILVVEDSREIRALAAILLRSAGYKVLEAAEGAEALETARAHGGPIDLLLTDIFMPRMNGWELADRLRRMQPNLRVLMMSGNYMDSESEGGDREAPGFVGEYLSKPFTASQLLGTVRRMLGRDQNGERARGA